MGISRHRAFKEENMTLKGNRNGMFCIEHENGFSLAIKCESFHTYVFTFVSSEDDENDLSTLQVMQLLLIVIF